jgi:hypothetical protein
MEPTDLDAIVFGSEWVFRHPVTALPVADVKQGKVLMIHGDGHRSLFDISMMGGTRCWNLLERYLETDYLRN